MHCSVSSVLRKSGAGYEGCRVIDTFGDGTVLKKKCLTNNV